MLALNFTPFPVLSTERLLFRQLTLDDTHEIFRLRSDERVNQFLGRNQCKSLEEAGVFINKIIRNVINNDSIYWAISLKNDRRLIGTICLWNIQVENHRAEIGYELHPEHWKKGIMTEALPKIVEFAFDQMNLHSIEADVDPANLRSVVLLEKNGFVKEGQFTEANYINGRYVGRAVYSRVKTG